MWERLREPTGVPPEFGEEWDRTGKMEKDHRAEVVVGTHLENSDGRGRGDYSSICVETRDHDGPGWPMGRKTLDNGGREAWAGL